MSCPIDPKPISSTTRANSAASNVPSPLLSYFLKICSSADVSSPVEVLSVQRKYSSMVMSPDLLTSTSSKV